MLELGTDDHDVAFAIVYLDGEASIQSVYMCI